MTIILGLDVSTSCTGVSVVDSDIEPDDKGSHVLLLDHISFKGCKTLWDKADVAQRALNDIKQLLFSSRAAPNVRWHAVNVERIVVEEPLMGFRTGMSSAQTISTLMKFNGIVSYLARQTFQVEPEYINASRARKLCGIKLQKTAVCGKSQKEQTAEHMLMYDLKHVTWPQTRTGKMANWAYDAIDAYVIAKAASISFMSTGQQKPNPGLTT